MSSFKNFIGLDGVCLYFGDECKLSSKCPKDCPRRQRKMQMENIKSKPQCKYEPGVCDPDKCGYTCPEKNKDTQDTTILKDGEGNIIMEIKDSGDRREFNTGAVRDMQEGKGRCDLLPACAILRLSRHYENGARKYDERNWEKGIPISVMIDSGMRHLLKYLDGQTDEDHLVAACWNLMGAMWMEEKHPELQDIPTREKRVQNGSVMSKIFGIDIPNPSQK